MNKQTGNSAQELHAGYRDLITRDEAGAIFAIGPSDGADYLAGAAKRLAR